MPKQILLLITLMIALHCKGQIADAIVVDSVYYPQSQPAIHYFSKEHKYQFSLLRTSNDTTHVLAIFENQSAASMGYATWKHSGYYLGGYWDVGYEYLIISEGNTPFLMKVIPSGTADSFYIDIGAHAEFQLAFCMCTNVERMVDYIRTNEGDGRMEERMINKTKHFHFVQSVTNYSNIPGLFVEIIANNVSKNIQKNKPIRLDIWQRK